MNYPVAFWGVFMLALCMFLILLITNNDKREDCLRRQGRYECQCVGPSE